MGSIEADPIRESLDRLTNYSDTAMVYGFFRFGVFRVEDKLYELGKKVLDYDSLCHEELIPKSFSVIVNPEDDTHTLKDCCKLTLTNYVLQNYLKSLRGEKIAPLIFCIDSNMNPFPKFSVSNPIGYRKAKKLDLVTVAELRRAYKLCYDKSVNPKIRKVALQTFKFIKVDLDNNGGLKGFKKVSPPWVNRKPISTKWGWKKCRDPKNWRYQVNTVVKFMSQRKEK